MQINGQRINLQEVEGILQNHPRVHAAAAQLSAVPVCDPPTTHSTFNIMIALCVDSGGVTLKQYMLTRGAMLSKDSYQTRIKSHGWV